MKLTYKYLVACALLSISIVTNAGNDEKRGQAGATELLMNPWAKSAGYAGSNIAGISGVEAMRFNVAGIADTNGMGLAFSNTQFMQGSDVISNSVGWIKSVGKSGTIGLSLMSLQLGEFIQTTVSQPEGTGITYTPTYYNLGIGYSKRFSSAIDGGILIRVVNESISNISTTGVAFDAGLQYHPDSSKFKFGVSLRNVGSSMTPSGDGLSSRGQITAGNQFSQSLNQKAETFEMPTALYIGLGYDIYETGDGMHKLTVMGAFNSNSYTKDRYLLGGEYTFKNLLVLRAGLDYYTGVFASTYPEKTDATGGPTGGLTLKKAYGDTGREFGIDYAYRYTNPFGGTHSIGLSFDF